VLAAIVEQSHDDDGIIWPDSVAPYDIHLIALRGAEEIAEQAAQRLSDSGYDVLLDDRDQRPGEKFADADLIGAPTRVTVGRKTLDDGAVDVRDRATGDEQRVELERVVEGVRQ
jgi:prolyl-tRNA synthetase